MIDWIKKLIKQLIKQFADVEGENLLAPNTFYRRVRISSIVEKGRRQIKTKKGNTVSTEDLPFWQNSQKFAKKKVKKR